jgi:hypothetical protein
VKKVKKSMMMRKMRKRKNEQIIKNKKEGAII